VLEPEVRAYEPELALLAGETGYEAYRALLPAALPLLERGGWLALEIGWKQAGEVEKLARRHGYGEIDVRPDLRGIPRVLLARRP
jgi:release factor glutamine methyltransferase